MFYLVAIKQCFLNFSFKNSQDSKSNFLKFWSGQCLLLYGKMREMKKKIFSRVYKNIHEIKSVFSLCKILLYNRDKDEIMTKKSPNFL